MIIELNMVTVVAIASCIVAVGGAIKILIEFKRAMQAPFKEVNEKIDTIEAWLDNDKKHLDKIDGAIAELGEATNLLVAAFKVSLVHMKDGNNTGEISKQVEKLDEWLIGRKDYKI